MAYKVESWDAVASKNIKNLQKSSRPFTTFKRHLLVGDISPTSTLPHHNKDTMYLFKSESFYCFTTKFQREVVVEKYRWWLYLLTIVVTGDIWVLIMTSPFIKPEIENSPTYSITKIKVSNQLCWRPNIFDLRNLGIFGTLLLVRYELYYAICLDQNNL